MQAMPDDVIKIDNGIMRFEGPGRYSRNVDLDAEPMKTIVATMAAKKIYSDPTMVAFEGLYVPENGDLSPAYALLSEHYRLRPNAVLLGRLRRAEGSYPRRLSRQLGENGSASDPNV